MKPTKQLTSILLLVVALALAGCGQVMYDATSTTGVTFDNVTADNSFIGLIAIGPSNTVQNSGFSDSTYMGIWVLGSNFEVHDTTFTNNHIGVYANPTEQSLEAFSLITPNNLVIHDNNFTDNDLGTEVYSLFTDSANTSFFKPITGLQIYDNHFDNNIQAGASVVGLIEGSITANTFANHNANSALTMFIYGPNNFASTTVDSTGLVTYIFPTQTGATTSLLVSDNTFLDNSFDYLLMGQKTTVRDNVFDGATTSLVLADGTTLVSTELDPNAHNIHPLNNETSGNLIKDNTFQNTSSIALIANATINGNPNTAYVFGADFAQPGGFGRLLSNYTANLSIENTIRENTFLTKGVLDGDHNISGTIKTNVYCENTYDASISAANQLGTAACTASSSGGGSTTSACSPLYDCSGWSSCLSGTQTRTCETVISCSGAVAPATERSCLCAVSWDCESWSACVDGKEKRSCTLIPGCQETEPPETSRDCVIVEEEPATPATPPTTAPPQTQQPSGILPPLETVEKAKLTGVFAGIAAIAVLAVIGVAAYLHFRPPKLLDSSKKASIASTAKESVPQKVVQKPKPTSDKASEAIADIDAKLSDLTKELDELQRAFK